ncbi:hypothetical protein NDU88_007007 [Pleurodeles waltl]|uniref:Uncharacterized protein n=1 Tax=Pleurodeles waltl TaxID=8319 RepID=A0AAV7N136_PLEWA|nr:hypothetical protein NDU88_007007 [Pleurodeles waltl]
MKFRWEFQHEQRTATAQQPDCVVLTSRIPVKRKVRSEGTKNLCSALQHPDIVRKKIGKRKKLGRIEGPLVMEKPEELVVSPVGVVPKKEQGQYRLIHQLSFPEGESVNDAINPEECTASYTSVVDLVRAIGPGALMGKTDIESALRLVRTCTPRHLPPPGFSIEWGDLL